MKSMTTLNREAAAAMKSVEVRAATDVTGTVSWATSATCSFSPA